MPGQAPLPGFFASGAWGGVSCGSRKPLFWVLRSLITQLFSLYMKLDLRYMVGK